MAQELLLEWHLPTAAGDLLRLFRILLFIFVALCGHSYAETVTGNGSASSLIEEIPQSAKFTDPKDELRNDNTQTQVRFLEMRDGSHYTFQDEPTTVGQREAFRALTEAEIEVFQARRLLALKRAAQLFHRTRWVAGVGSLSKEKLSQLVPSKRALRHPILALTGRLPKAEEGATPPKKGIGKRGQQLIQSLLFALDKEMWDNPNVIAKANEFGLGITAGVAGGAAAGRTGIYRLGEVGISLGFNWETKTMVFDVFTDYEKNNFVAGFYAKATVNGKLMPFLRTVGSEGVKTERGLIRFPPTPTAIMTTENSLHLGPALGLGLGTIPPLFPFPTIIYTDDTISRKPWLRVGVSFRGPKFLLFQGKLVDGAKAGFHHTGQLLGALKRATVTGIRKLCDFALSGLGGER